MLGPGVFEILGVRVDSVCHAIYVLGIVVPQLLRLRLRLLLWISEDCNKHHRHPSAAPILCVDLHRRADK